MSHFFRYSLNKKSILKVEISIQCSPVHFGFFGGSSCRHLLNRFLKFVVLEFSFFDFLFKLEKERIDSFVQRRISYFFQFFNVFFIVFVRIVHGFSRCENTLNQSFLHSNSTTIDEIKSMHFNIQLTEC